MFPNIYDRDECQVIIFGLSKEEVAYLLHEMSDCDLWIKDRRDADQSIRAVEIHKAKGSQDRHVVGMRAHSPNMGNAESVGLLGEMLLEIVSERLVDAMPTSLVILPPGFWMSWEEIHAAFEKERDPPPRPPH